MYGMDNTTSWVWLVTASFVFFIQNTGMTSASSTSEPLRTHMTQLQHYTKETSHPIAGKVPPYKEKAEVGDAKFAGVNETMNKDDLLDDYQSNSTQSTRVALDQTVLESNGAGDGTSRLETSTEPVNTRSNKGYAIQLTIFKNRGLVAGLIIFEIVVYVATVTIVLWMHSRNRKWSRAEQERELVSRFLNEIRDCQEEPIQRQFSSV